MDALNCLKADYGALKTIPGHHLHDYFHVINYSTWSHEVIGEATVKRSDYPSAKAVDAAIARMLAQSREKALKATPQPTSLAKVHCGLREIRSSGCGGGVGRVFMRYF
jgi:hypothetical protein